MFQTITFKGFEAQVTGCVTSGSYGGVGLIYLEMAGDEAQVKAIWAKLVSADSKKSGGSDEVTRGKYSIRMERNVKYITLRTALDNGQVCMALVHPQATVLAEGASFYLIAEAGHEGPPASSSPASAQLSLIPAVGRVKDWIWGD